MRKIKLGATLCLTFVLVATGIFACGLLTGCGEEKCVTGEGGVQLDFAATNKKKTTIKVYADGEDYMAELIPAFEAANPTINVEFTQVGTVDSRARMQLEGKDGADVFVFPHDHIGAAVGSKMLMEMPEDVATRLSETLIDSTMATVKNNGKYIGVPLSAETIGLFYNEELVIEVLEDAKVGLADKAAEIKAGKALDEVLTLNEIFEIGQKYNTISGEENNYFFGIDIDDFYHSQLFLSAFGYQIFGETHDDATKPNFTQAGVKKGLEFILNYAYKDGDVTKDRVMPLTSALTSDNYTKSFYAGNTAIISCGPWCIADAKKGAEDSGFTLRVTKYPVITEGNEKLQPYTFSGVQVAGVSAYTQHAGEAWKFAEFMASAEGASILYKTTGKLPCLKDTSSIDGLASDEYLSGISKQLAFANAMPSITEMGYMWTIGATLFQQVFDGSDIDKAIADADASYKQLAKL